MSNALCYVYGLVALQLVASVLSVNVRSNEKQWKTLKEKVQTFGQFTEEVGHEISPSTLELLRHFKDRKISLIVERSSVYQNAAAEISKEYKDSVESVSYLVSAVEYSFEEDSASVIRVTKEAAAKSKVVVMVMSLRLAKECLVAAYDMDLHLGDHVFVTYEVDILNMLSLQQRPFKWPIVSYTTSISETYNGYILRSRKLCWMLEHTFVVMVTLPKHVMQVLSRRVPKLFRRRIRLDGVDMWKGIENSELSMAGPFRAFLNKNGNVKYPLAVYRYGNGKGAGDRCANILTNILSLSPSAEDSSNYPQMHPVATFKLINKQHCPTCSGTWKLSLTRRNKSHTYKTFSRDALTDLKKPTCVDDDENCMRTKGKFPVVELIFVLCVAAILLIAFIGMYRQYRKTQRKQCDDGTSLISSEVKLTQDTECKQPVNV